MSIGFVPDASGSAPVSSTITAISRFWWIVSCSWVRARSSMLPSRSRNAPSASAPGSPRICSNRCLALDTLRERAFHSPPPSPPYDSGIVFNASRRQ